MFKRQQAASKSAANRKHYIHPFQIIAADSGNQFASSLTHYDFSDPLSSSLLFAVRSYNRSPIPETCLLCLLAR